MKRFLRIGAACVLALAAIRASAMPLGARLAVHGRSAVRQTAAESASQVWTVTFDLNYADATERVPPMVVTNGCAIGELPSATRSGYTFTGWFTAADGGDEVVADIVATGDMTLYAHWALSQYTVTFDANGGEGGWSRLMDYGTALSAPAVTRTGYTFTGWSPSVAATVPASDVTYTAQWKANQYAVTFDANGGDGDMPDQTFAYDEAKELDAAAFTMEGCSHAGWATNATDEAVYPAGAVVSNLTATAGDVITLFAKWTTNAYTVTFDANGGEGGKAVTQDFGTALSAPTVTHTGYTFTGWSPSVATTVPASDVTYTAQWKANQYTATFDANGGEGGWSRSMDYGAVIVAPTVTRTGYTFTGWSPSVAATVPASNVTFVATWTAVPPPEPTMWTVSFDLNYADATERVPPVVVTNGCTIGALPLATRSGYTFDGWFTAAEVGSWVSNDTVITANLTLYAHWTAIHVTEPEPEPDPMPTNVVEEITYAGVLDTSFAKAQTVNGALYKGDAFVGTVQVKVGKVSKKGVVKVSATATMLIGGKAKKVTAKAVSIDARRVGDNAPYQIAFKNPIGEMTFEMAADGKFTLKNNSYVMVEAEVGGALKSGSHGTFRLNGFDLAAPGEIQEELLPHEETFEVAGTKWKFDKAASVKWAKPKKGVERSDYYDDASGKDLIVDTSKGRSNLSGLKLTYTAKTGQFKGSFKAYALEEANGKTKLKKYTVNVIGFVVGGKGVGEARCKKPAAGPWAVTVE